MTAELTEGQYELGSVVFGSSTLYPVEACEPGGYGVKVGDYAVPKSDEIRFGQDHLEPGNLQFTMGVLDNRPQWNSVLPLEEMQYEGARKYLEKLAAEWKSDDTRGKWGEVRVLRYCRGGQTRRAYGRPRKFVHSALTMKSEYIPVASEFQLADTNFYSDEEFHTQILPDSPGTLQRREGMAKAWFQVFITGPVVNPTLTFSGLFQIQLNHTIQAGRLVQLSSYPWERRVVESTGANLSPLLAGTTPYLADLRIPPGATTTISLTGSGMSGTTKADVLWREVYHSF